ncbi:MAG TPA: hypothetical protein VK099_06335 [Alcanivoracaceae bacterium]|nr:hypothetical protein [Alcanivoracaceae bacterium]
MAGAYASIAIKHLVPHPDIKQILAKSLATYRPENYSFLSDEMLLLMQKSRPIHAIKNNDNCAVFFAGWELLSELRHRNIETAWVVVHEKEPEKIELWALQNELGQALYIRENSSLKRQYFYDLLNNSKPLWKEIFARPKPRSVVAALQRLCDLSRGEARGVKTKSTPKESPPSPLELLLAAEQGAGND